MLQITDTHVDLHYKAGSNANCPDPICCRETSGSLKS